MGTKRVWTIKEIADEIGYSRVTVHNDLKNGVLRAARANPERTGKFKLRSGPELSSYMQRKKDARKKRAARRPRKSRAGETTLKLIKLLELMHKKKTPVCAEDKEWALWYVRCVTALKYLGSRVPLLAGVYAVYRPLLTHGHVWSLNFCERPTDIEEIIENWPTKPQTESPSSNASAQ
jgi:hypothetical protein